MSRPVTSAYICPRSRNTGRSTRKPRKTTRPKAARATRVRSVTRGLIRSITVKARDAVRRPPASSMRPVPTRFRNPSTSFMTRDTRSPDLFASWNAIGRRPTCSCTRMRMSAISCCAALETSCTSAKEPRPWTTVAATTAPTRGSSSSTWRRPMTSSIRYLVEAGRTRPATRLTAMSTKATARRPRRGFMRAQTSGKSARRRSGFRPRADCLDSLVATRAAPLTFAFYLGGGERAGAGGGGAGDGGQGTGKTGAGLRRGLPGGLTEKRKATEKRATERRYETGPRTRGPLVMGERSDRPALARGSGVSSRSSSRPTRGLRRPAPLGLAGRPELLDDPPQVVGPPALQAVDDRAIQAVQELVAASTLDEQGDEVAGRSMVQ